VCFCVRSPLSTDYIQSAFGCCEECWYWYYLHTMNKVLENSVSNSIYKVLFKQAFSKGILMSTHVQKSYSEHKRVGHIYVMHMQVSWQIVPNSWSRNKETLWTIALQFTLAQDSVTVNYLQPSWLSNFNNPATCTRLLCIHMVTTHICLSLWIYYLQRKRWF